MLDFILIALILFQCIMVVVGYVRSYRRGEQTGCTGDCRHCAIECGGSYKYALKANRDGIKLQKQFQEGMLAYSQEEGRAYLIDIRSPKEYKKHHLPGSINIPLGQIDQIISIVHDPDLPVYLCGPSAGQSETAANAVRELGYTRVTDVGKMQQL